MRFIIIFIILQWVLKTNAQDTSVVIDEKRITLGEVVVRNNLDYNKLLLRIKNDTSFYKAFKNLRILNFSAFNDIKMLDKKGKVVASLFSKTRQSRSNHCRSMQVLEEQITGDFYTKSGEYNYTTPELYASLFFTKGTVCGETNLVSVKNNRTTQLKGLEKHKEQLKMLFFNPGKKIPGIPFIGDKLDLYDQDAKKLYQYRLDSETYLGKQAYVFTVKPLDDLNFIKNDRIVIDEMVTWFDPVTLDILGRNYTLSYKAGVYSFDVHMEVEMQHFEDMIVPKVLRYKGEWNVIFKKKERAVFTATLYDFKKE